MKKEQKQTEVKLYTTHELFELLRNLKTQVRIVQQELYTRWDPETGRYKEKK